MVEVRLEVGIDASQKIDSSGNKIVLIQSRFSPISGPEGDRYVTRRTASTSTITVIVSEATTKQLHSLERRVYVGGFYKLKLL